MFKLYLNGDFMTCTFFGHSWAPVSLIPEIKSAVLDLIENHGVDKFYVGTHGNFDRMVFEVLEELSSKYDIDYKKVLPRVPVKKQDYDRTDYSRAVVPDGIEKTLPKYGINYRNRWMIKHSDYVITYITNIYGNGAAVYAELAEKQKKVIIKLVTE